MNEFGIGLLDEDIDFIDEYEDAQEIESMVAEAVYSSLEGARNDLIDTTTNMSLADALTESEIIMDTPFSGRLILNDDASEMLEIEERGYPGFDIKIGLLNSPKAKVTASGQRYINVPFKGNNRGFNPLRLGRRISDRFFAQFGGGVAEDFKRVSDVTPAYKWIYPGIGAHPYFDRVQLQAQNDLLNQVSEIQREYQ